MPICHSRKFIFLHIPRCGGTSLEKCLGLFRRSALYGTISTPNGVLVLQHLTGQTMLESGLVDKQMYTDYFKFTVVRDPFPRMASDFLWQQRHDRHNEFRQLSFGQYLARAERIISDDLYFEKVHYEHFRPMVEYCVFEGELMLDDILLLEHLEAGLRRLEKVLGPVKPEQLNASATYDELDTPRNRERVYRLYEADKALHEKLVRVERDGLAQAKTTRPDS